MRPEPVARVQVTLNKPQRGFTVKPRGVLSEYFAAGAVDGDHQRRDVGIRGQFIAQDAKLAGGGDAEVHPALKIVVCPLLFSW